MPEIPPTISVHPDLSPKPPPVVPKIEIPATSVSSDQPVPPPDSGHISARQVLTATADASPAEGKTGVEIESNEPIKVGTSEGGNRSIKERGTSAEPVITGDTSESQSQAPSEQTTDLAKITDAISGEGDSNIDLGWIQDNITSIQTTTSLGEHDKVFYPACGTDILRTMVSYDATEITAVDTDGTLIPRISAQFEEAGIPLSINTIDDTTQELICAYGGKERRIKFQQADARLVISELPARSVDVLHIFLPTGAESQIADNVGSRVVNLLTLENYNLVRAGGYMVFDERQVTPFGETPAALLKIAGIEEQKITRRHPLTVSTSFYPTSEEIARMDRTGFIYHKTSEVGAELVGDVLEGVDQRLNSDYVLMEIGRGGFEYLGVDPENTDVVTAITKFSEEQHVEVSKIAKSMSSHGATAEDVQAYEQENRSGFLSRLQKIQEQYKEFLVAFKKVAAKVEDKTISNGQALEELGIVRGEYGMESRKWPIALEFVQNAKKNGVSVRDAVQQLVSFDLAKLHGE